MRSRKGACRSRAKPTRPSFLRSVFVGEAGAPSLSLAASLSSAFLRGVQVKGLLVGQLEGIDPVHCVTSKAAP